MGGSKRDAARHSRHAYDPCVTQAPDYSVIVPAYNEERQLARTLPAMREAMAGTDLPGELIVVDNNSSDATAEVARRHGARVVFEPVNQIARARNAGAAAASSGQLIFVDADTAPSAELLNAALDALKQPDCVGGGAKVVLDPPPPWVAQRLLALWNLLSHQAGWPAGCFFFCRRDAFEAVEGFSEAHYASEEIWLARRLKRWGRRNRMSMRILPEQVLSSSRKTDNTPRMLGMLALMVIFPLATRFRGMCGYWYKRGEEAGPT